MFNRVFDDEDGSDAVHTYTSGGLKYAEMVVKSPKGMAPYTEHADNTWTPNQGPWMMTMYGTVDGVRTMVASRGCVSSLV